MKMQNAICSPVTGKIRSVLVKEGKKMKEVVMFEFDKRLPVFGVRYGRKSARVVGLAGLNKA
jgi:hypothetical protein